MDMKGISISILRERLILAANGPVAEEIVRKTLKGPPLELIAVDSNRRIAA